MVWEDIMDNCGICKTAGQCRLTAFIAWGVRLIPIPGNSEIRIHRLGYVACACLYYNNGKQNTRLAKGYQCFRIYLGRIIWQMRKIDLKNTRFKRYLTVSLMRIITSWRPAKNGR